MIAILSYLVLALFLGGSLYILGLMFYLVIKKGETRVKPIDPKGNKSQRLPKAA
ncbi:hypothetical protein OKW21_000370 [Catalinimonas alkaloidigena]|nr:hypothetical protein [Catalinimonas alkaloidigena]